MVKVGDNLPVLATRVGGELVDVLAWEQHALLPRNVQYAIAKIVSANPALNTESRVDLLADMAGYHSEPIDTEIAELIDEHGPEMVYNVIDFLYEIGKRDRSGGTRLDLREAVDAFETLDKAGIDVQSHENVYAIVMALGGLVAVAALSPSGLIEALEDSAVPQNDESLEE